MQSFECLKINDLDMLFYTSLFNLSETSHSESENLVSSRKMEKRLGDVLSTKIRTRSSLAE